LHEYQKKGVEKFAICKRMKTKDGQSGGQRESSWLGVCGPPPPMFFVSADSKELTGAISVTADSAGLKVVVFSMSWKWLATAHSKGVTRAICL
jgi:hypothetical protein